jgi:hypothetical protein
MASNIRFEFDLIPKVDHRKCNQPSGILTTGPAKAVIEPIGTLAIFERFLHAAL